MTSASAQLCDDPEFIDSRRKFNRQLFELCIECGDFFLQSGDDDAMVTRRRSDSRQARLRSTRRTKTRKHVAEHRFAARLWPT